MKNLFFILFIFSAVLFVGCTDKEENIIEQEEFELGIFKNPNSIPDFDTNPFPENYQSRVGDFRIHKSKGSISNFRFFKKLKWDVTQDYGSEIATVQGSTAKFVFDNGSERIDLEMEPLCTCILDDEEKKALNGFKISKVNEGSNFEEGEFVLFLGSDRDKYGDPDKVGLGLVFDFPGFADRLIDLEIIENESEYCLYYAAINAELQNSSLKNRLAIPEDDWIKVKGIE